MTEKLKDFLNSKLTDCERVFEDANVNSDVIFMNGLLRHGGETNALLMAIGKRQAYIEVYDFLRKNGGI